MDTQSPISPRYSPDNNRPHPHLRVVSREGLFELPRRYDQSTSGRTDSTDTTPPLSRSSAMAVDSAIRCLAEMALRKYPIVVPQRLAYDSWSSGTREFRYLRSASALIGSSDISPTLPCGKVVATPFGHLPGARASYDERVTLHDTRRRRLRLLLRQYGSQKELAAACGFISDNYLSQLLSLKKSFGEKAARKIEQATKKPPGWLDSDEEQDAAPPPMWPFHFDRTLWDRLPESRKRTLEESFLTLVLGASVQEAAAPGPRRRQG